MTPTPRKTKTAEHKRKRFGWLASLREAAWLTLVVAGGVFFGGTLVYFFGVLSVEGIKNPRLPQATILYDRTGQHELYRMYEEANRELIPHENIPDVVRQATIAAEDERFYSHFGVDPAAIIRAAIVNYQQKRITQGASTITQQLARSLFLTREQTFERKISEMFLALKIESRLSKIEILDLYLNIVPYGSNAYGIETAAQTFFDKSARDLELDEAILLSALPNAPTLYSPYGSNTRALEDRYRQIARKMHELGFISAEERDRVLEAKVLARVAPPRRPITAPHFVFFAIEELERVYGADVLPTAGLKVLTTIDLELQAQAESAVREGAARNLARGARNAALVAVDTENGEVLTMVGSKDYFDTSIDGEVNITTSLRQPGSSFKPLVYAAAFEKDFQPETPIYDIPIDFGPDGTGGRYVPQNYDGRFHGRMTMREALARSLNIPAVTTMALIGLTPTIEFAQKMGITTLTQPERYGLSLVLGGAEVRPLDMASAFAVFAREGERIAPTAILQVEKNGEAVAFGEPRTPERVLDPEIARKINSILSDNRARAATFGGASPLAFPASVSVAAKTGTTQNNRDAWAVGYNSEIAVAVWAGNNDNTPMREGSDGVYVAAPIWRAFMNDALEKHPGITFSPYREVESPFGEQINLLSTRIRYFDRKHDREISEEEARELKESRVRRVSELDYILNAARDADESTNQEGEGRQRNLTSIETIRRLYYPRTTEVAP